MIDGIHFRVSADGRAEVSPTSCYIVSKSAINNVVANVTKLSPFAYQFQLRGGYITLSGGHRVGICGKISCSSDGMVNFSEVCSVNIRVCKSRMMYGEWVFDKLCAGKNVYNTCVVSPPGCGKTTFLKNYIMYLANIRPDIHICVADEREELCGGSAEVLRYMGSNTSVLSVCSKNKASEMFLRCMSPGVVVFDEVWTEEDYTAVRNVITAGVPAVFSVHGTSYAQVSVRREFEHISGYIQCCADISRRCGAGTVERAERMM